MKILIIINFILLGCSSVSEKNVLVGNVKLNNGTYQGEDWSEDFYLKRVTWHRGLTSEFDTYFAKISRSSNFFKWFGEDVQSFNQCDTFIVSLTNNNLKDNNFYLII